ncbi:hypothetical protein [Roseivirga sp. E12]|uniref:hypothetical protein n=1 Tax=Roseivirga sp. E12 TaxID=2819237 RepID=UPI001ABC443E|nr:hypothetical protein [Roseivirga sp. E12]MBO3699107.1 hypothetical protein [Roseivirga sp. E12]
MTKENQFSPKMESKSVRELKTILNSKGDYTIEAQQAAAWELEKRGSISEVDIDIKPIVLKGERQYRDFLKTVKPNHSFGFNLKSADSFETKTEYKVISSIFAEAFEKLGWHIVYHQEDQIEAKRANSSDVLTEKISVIIQKSGSVNILSESLRGSLWDMGNNSKRIQLLIHVFKEIQSSYDDEKINSLLSEIEKSETLADYVIPETLPQPNSKKEPLLWVVISMGVVSSLALGFIFALASKYFYIVIFYESLIAIALAFLLAEGAKWGNYSNYTILRSILGFASLAIVVLGQYFQHFLLQLENVNYSLTFAEFIRLRFEAGFEFDGFNTGWIGMSILLIAQLVIIYSLGVLNFIRRLSSYLIERIPREVLDFAFYHWVKSESESVVRKELSLKGWVSKDDQDRVFEAFDAMHVEQDLLRSK